MKKCGRSRAVHRTERPHTRTDDLVEGKVVSPFSSAYPLALLCLVSDGTVQLPDALEDCFPPIPASGPNR
jgi:hypothetical protein